MSEKVNLSDLGLEMEPTPAEKAMKGNSDPIMIIPNSGENKVQTVKSNITPTEVNRDNPNVLVTPNGLTKSVQNENSNEKPEIKEPEYKQLDLKAFAAAHPKKKELTPYQRTKNDMLKKLDDNVERTKKDLTRPGGRIDEGKHKYVDDEYEKLVRKAKKDKSIAEQMKKVNDAIESDPRFDGITEYQRRAYILFIVNKDNSTGVNDEYFGIEEKQQPNSPNSINRETGITEKKIDDSFIYNSTTPATTNTNGNLIKQQEPKDDDNLNLDSETEEENNEASDLTSDPYDVEYEGIDDSENENNEDVYEDDSSDSDDSKDDDDEPGPSEEQLKKIRKRFKESVEEALNLDSKSTGIDGFVVSTRPIKLNSALNVKRDISRTVSWPLIYSGKLISLTPFSGEEIIALNPRVTNISTVAGLKKLFSIIYHHVVEPKKPPFEVWLKQIPNYDVNGLLFAVYVANFKDTNYITYECTRKSCSSVFIEKKEIKDMVVFPNDKIKERFETIMNKEPLSSQYYKTKIVPISKDYAFGFAMNSVYSSLFEPSALTPETRKKYNTVVNIMPNIDKVYRINRDGNELIPISFGIVPNSLSKTVLRKVKALDSILKQLTVDERAIVVSEVTKLENKQMQDNITYKLPEAECDVCHTVIEEQETGPFDLLFTRAQLPVLAASIQE